MALRTLTGLYTHQHHPPPELSCLPKLKLCHHYTLLISLLPASLDTHHSTLCLGEFDRSRYLPEAESHSVCPSVSAWFPSFSVTSSRPICVTLWISIPVLLFHGTGYHALRIHSSVRGHLGCFHLLAIANNVVFPFGRISLRYQKNLHRERASTEQEMRISHWQRTANQELESGNHRPKVTSPSAH